MEFKLKLKFKGEKPSVTVTRYIFCSDGFMSMTEDLHHAMSRGADRATVSDGYVKVKFENLSRWGGLPYSVTGSKVAQKLIDAMERKSGFVKGIHAALHTLIMCQEAVEEALCPECRMNCGEAADVDYGEGSVVAPVGESV